MRSIRRICVCVLRFGGREPVQRALTASRFVKKHLVRGAVLGVLPSTINDVAFHHANLNVSEIVHVAVDTATVSSMNAVANILIAATKLPL